MNKIALVLVALFLLGCISDSGKVYSQEESRSDFSSLISPVIAGNSEFKVQYLIHSPEGEQVSDTVVKGYKMRADYFNQGANFSFIYDGSNSYSCVSSFSSSCVVDNNFHPKKLWLEQLETVSSSKDFSIVEYSRTNIIGEDVSCFEVKNTHDTNPPIVDACLDSRGALLYQNVRNQTSTVEINATSYSSKVSEGEFSPPYPITAPK